MSQLGTYNFIAIETLRGNLGGKIFPKASNIDIVGDGVTVLVTGNPVTGTLTITTPGSLTSLTTDIAGPVLPVLGSIGIRGGNNITTNGGTAHRVIINLTGTTNHALQIGNVGGSLTSAAVGVVGEILVGVGAGAADPKWLGAGTTGKILRAVTAADPAWTTSTFADTYAIGTILHAGAANTITGLTAGAVGEILQGNTGAAPSWLAAGTDGKILTAHTGAAVTWENTLSTGKTAGNTFVLQAYNVAGVAYIPMITMTAGANAGTTTMDFASAATIGGQYIYRVGGTDVSVADGGTGQSAFTQYGVLLGNAGNALNVTAAGTNGQILRATTGANPGWSTATLPDTYVKGDILTATAANVIGPITAVAVGSVLISNGIGDVAIWSATPTVTTLTATTLRTGDPGTAAACVTLAGTTLTATGTGANVPLSLTAKGTGAINLTTSIPVNSAVPASGIVYRGLAAGWSSSEWRTEQHTIQTNGAAATPILSIPLVNSLMVSIKIIINGFRDDFSNCVGGEILATAFRNNAGGDITLVGAPIINVNYANPLDTSDIDADVDVPSQSLRLRVIGTAGDNWNWVATATYMYTISNV